ncbi:MAG TPA: hypothetical protein VGX28_06570 [Frankiaceae bacterium]|jgi:hypothetical protein|nr:hypothetical protein [Frankiaceae bacterium]
MRRLTLKSETLADLTADELTGVAGGATPVCVTYQASACNACVLTPPDVVALTRRVTEQTCTW